MKLRRERFYVLLKVNRFRLLDKSQKNNELHWDQRKVGILTFKIWVMSSVLLERGGGGREKEKKEREDKKRRSWTGQDSSKDLKNNTVSFILLRLYTFYSSYYIT